MRFCLFFLISYLILGVSSAQGMDVFLGTVQSIERNTGEVIVHVSDNNEEDNISKEIKVQIDPDLLPECIETGKTVRIWGKYIIKGEVKIFQAQHIKGGNFWNRKTDPTGVRFRLGRGFRGFGPGMKGGGMGRPRH